jgi:hypothetical protein
MSPNSCAVAARRRHRRHCASLDAVAQQADRHFPVRAGSDLEVQPLHVSTEWPATDVMRSPGDIHLRRRRVGADDAHDRRLVLNAGKSPIQHDRGERDCQSRFMVGP